uniref:UrcA family protein n=1 Tax=uncultured marine microorganism TaxID=415540 RepID=A5CFX7_9ZZZZ|nr:hypothetical protein [uncultured marine microorganism]
MKESKLFRSLVATFVVIVLSGPAVVLAGTLSYIEDDKVAVSYADLKLESEEGVRALYRRLKRASKEVCGIRPPKIYGASVYHMWDSQRCYRATLSNAVYKYDNDDLTRIHAG